MANIIVLDDHRIARSERDESQSADAPPARATVISLDAHRCAQQQNCHSENAEAILADKAIVEGLRRLIRTEVSKQTERRLDPAIELLEGCAETIQTVSDLYKLVRELVAEVEKLKRRGKRGPRRQG